MSVIHAVMLAIYTAVGGFTLATWTATVARARVVGEPDIRDLLTRRRWRAAAYTVGVVGATAWPALLLIIAAVQARSSPPRP